MKIMLIMNDISLFGGVERVVANLSNNFIKEHEVYVVSIFNVNRNIPFIYDERIKIIKLSKFQKIVLKNMKNPIIKVFRELSRPFVRIINKNIEKQIANRLKQSILNLRPDIIIDNSYNFTNNIFDETMCAVKFVHGKFEHYHELVTLHNFKNIILLSSQELDSYKNEYPNSNFYVIPNFLPSIADLNTNPAQKVVLSVGRLTDQKSFLRLIDIWNLVQNGGKFADWKLKIVGDGELKEQILAKIKELNLENSIELKPFTTEVEKEYLSASIYAMSSHFEGLPMVLIEASACALPCIAFDVATGPRDIIDDGKSGYLVADNDLQEYANKLQILMSDENLRVQMGAKSKEIAKAKFSKEVVLKQWEEMFERIKSDK